MASLQDVNDLMERIGRIHERIGVRSGGGAEWQVDVPGFGLQIYRFTGIKSPSELEDDIASLAVWVWSVRDYAVAFLRERGAASAIVDQFIESDPDLPVCADLANSTKHLALRRSRSGRFLRVGKIRFEIPQSAIAAITFGAAEVQIDVARPEHVKFALPILDRSGEEVGDAIETLARGVAAWERLLRLADFSV